MVPFIIQCKIKNNVACVVFYYKIIYIIYICIYMCECDVNIGIYMYYIIFKNYKDSIYT
jgi:hypothetical protein